MEASDRSQSLRGVDFDGGKRRGGCWARADDLNVAAVVDVAAVVSDAALVGIAMYRGATTSSPIVFH